ncbi:MAG: phosphoribosylanthranilate isomerase [Methanomicrobiales archaeon]|nr:phosphoribosylanthranilate isomerase [Methanomicrobiales archaeon]
MRVKICGITSVADARAALRAGADAIGVVLASPSPRAVEPGRAAEIFAAAGPFAATVAVTTSASPGDIRAIVDLAPSAVQVPAGVSVPVRSGIRVIRMVAPGDAVPNDGDAILVDGSRGRGLPFDPAFARSCVRASSRPVILAGGLTPENVSAAIAAVGPYAVDVSSGVEQEPGIKDPGKIRAFIRAARSTQHD